MTEPVTWEKVDPRDFVGYWWRGKLVAASIRRTVRRRERRRSYCAWRLPKLAFKRVWRLEEGQP